MKTEALITQDWDDLVFENRNQAYGAYALRKSYTRRVVDGTLVSISIVVIAFFSPVIISKLWPKEAPVITSSDPFVELTKNPEIEITVKPPTPPKEVVRVKRIDPYVIPVASSLPIVDDPITPPDANTTQAGTDDGTDAPVEQSTNTGSANLGDGAGSGAAIAIVDDKPLDHAEFMPEYIGGIAAMMHFIGDRVKYPQAAKRIGQEGKVFVQFVINKDGSIGDVHVVRGVSADLDREAARVIALMPRWKPGRMGQMNVSVKMVLPVSFVLEN